MQSTDAQAGEQTERRGVISPGTEFLASLRLFWISCLALYVEVMLIRWIGTEVRVFAYFQNLALIACFLGFGIGAYRARKGSTALPAVVAMTILVVLVEWPDETWQQLLSGISNLLALSPDAALWGFPFLSQVTTPGLALIWLVAVATMSALLGLVILAMFPFGQLVAECFDASGHPARAYAVNLLGSTAGIWLFAAVAYWRLPPAVWFLSAFAGTLLVSGLQWKRLAATAAAMACAGLFLATANPANTFWSPYQKLSVKPTAEEGFIVEVNNTGYMEVPNFSPERLAKKPELARKVKESFYDSPFLFAAGRERVLVLGAGAGNDAAGALRNGAEHVDAVEIDPVIYDIGERRHPEEPYRSPRVHRIIDDARSFLSQRHPPYDVILFGFLDSHTQYSGYSNTRIDDYVYTEEALRQAQRLLKPDGILVLKFAVREPWTWIGQRFYEMLKGIFGRAPVVYAGTVFVASNSPQAWRRAADPEVREFLARHPVEYPLEGKPAPPPTTDNWPYLYHRKHSIPSTYLTVSAILFLIALLLARRAVERVDDQTVFFFLLGAGFFLLETQLVSRLGLYFGTTWLVNCVALTAILLVLTLAALLVERMDKVPLLLSLGLLLGTLLLTYLFPWEKLAVGAHTAGMLLSLGFAVPVFFSGIVFTGEFRLARSKSSALGANILGAVAGGLMQNASFVVGLKALLLMAAGVYLAALLSRKRGNTAWVRET